MEKMSAIKLYYSQAAGKQLINIPSSCYEIEKEFNNDKFWKR